MTPLAQKKDAATAYDDLAPHYDDFTAAYPHDAWVDAIERRATELGLTGRRALDLACGTGKSTLPLLARGYSVLACDISEGMVREARRKLPEYSDAFLVADMRDLPAIGEFDLVLCLDDAVNYLVSDGELEATFAGVASVLAPDGVFDSTSTRWRRIESRLRGRSSANGRACSTPGRGRARRAFAPESWPRPRWRSSSSATMGSGSDAQAATCSAIIGRGRCERRSRGQDSSAG